MSAEENKTLARRFCAALNAVTNGRDPATLSGQDVAIFDEIMTPDQAKATKQDLLPGAYGLWGDHHIEITDMVAEGDKVWARVTTNGGHTGEWKGVAPTGKRWTNTGVLFIHIVNGRIAEWDGQFDELGHLTQLGATITPPGR